MCPYENREVFLMKMDFFKKYSNILLMATSVILIYQIFMHLNLFLGWINLVYQILKPFILGLILAYFLNPLVNIVEKQLKNTFVKKYSRIISVLLIFFLFLLLIIGMLNYLIPGIIETAVDFAKLLPSYVREFEEAAKKNITNPDILAFVTRFELQILGFIQEIADINPISYIDIAFTATNKLYTILMGMVFCPYILFEKDRLLNIIERVLRLFVENHTVDVLKSYVGKINYIIGKFIYGKFVDSIIIGLIALVGFGIMKLPYYPILALVVLVTNMIPYFGPFIGGIPVTFIILLTEGLMPALIVAIFIFILQQFDGLILGPAILGDFVGVSAFWIIFSISLFGGLFGFIGMFLGVPFICIIRMLFHDYSDYKKKKLEINQE